MKKKYFGGYLSLRQMLYVIASVISLGILFFHISTIVKTIIFLSVVAILMTFAFLKIGNIYADKYFFNVLKYIFRKKIFIFERKKMIIAFIFILVGIIFMIGTLIYTRKKNNLQEVKPIDKSNIKKGKKTLSNLWGIDGFNNQVITINKNQHSIIIELESIEYSLLHDGEKANVDRELISIAQMLKFPIQFLEVKKQIEIGDMLEEIKISTINANDNVKEYANQIIAHLEKLQEDQNLFERKNYMVISSFNNRKVAESELKEFYQLLRYHLLNIKVSTRLLNDREIVELIYEQLHKGNKNKVADIEQKGGFELYVTDKTRKKD